VALEAESFRRSGTTWAMAVPIRTEADVVNARQSGRELAAAIGFNTIDQALIATAISELARNILKYAGNGEVHVRHQVALGRHGIEVVAADEGPGIANLADAMVDGFSTSGGLGLGMPGAKRLMDEFHVQTGATGTTITARKFMAADA
jgi:serine/threonine-protein kinase RsbT